jgi:uncharacterized protein
MMASGEDNLAAVRRTFEGIAAGNADQLLREWTEDLVLELPYADPPRRIEGKDAARAYLSQAFEIFRFALQITAVHECVDPDQLVIEYTSSGHIATTGRAYANTYIAVYGFRDGRIWRVKEFHNPLLVMRACSPE